MKTQITDMKKIFLFTLLIGSLHAFAQQERENNDAPRGFQKEKLFTGGSLNLGFSSYTTNIGIAPQFGYSLTNWLDAGVDLNVNYISDRDPYSAAKIHQTLIGPGVFVRLFPINFLFASAQFEYNFISSKYITGSASGDVKTKQEAPSLLLGIGYAGGRMKGSNTYYYFSVSADFLGAKNSPYIDAYDRMIPVVRAGYNIGLFQGRGRARY